MLGILLLTWVAYLAWHTAALRRSYEAAKETAAADITPSAVLRAGQILRQATPHARAIDSALRPLVPICDTLARVPFFRAGSQLRPLLDLSASLLDAGLTAFNALEPLLSTLAAQGEPDVSAILRHLDNNQSGLSAAETALTRAQAARANLDLDLFPAPLRDRLSVPISRLDDLLPQALGGLALLRLTPSLSGLNAERVYLVAAQNNEELRASGGFISALGPIRLRGGEVVSLDMSDSFLVDDFTKNYPPPPPAIQRIMLAGYWVPRDANWSPDFPQSASDLATLYTLSTGDSVQGVIAFDPIFIASLTQILGPLRVEGAPEAVTGSDVIHWMHNAWSPQPGKDIPRDWWKNRKAFIPALGRALLSALFDADSERVTAAARAAYQAIRQGHLLVWFSDPTEQAALTRSGLSGSVDPGTGDYLSLIDSNVGFNKTDALVRRRIAYDVDLQDPGRPRASFLVEYTNRAVRGLPCVHEARYGDDYEDLTQRCYWDYWRVLAAPGSVLTAGESPGIPPGPGLLDRQGWPATVVQAAGPASTVEFSGMLLVEPSQSGGFNLRWDLPPAVLRPTASGYRYTLKLVKQPGISLLPVSILITPPNGCAEASGNPKEINLQKAETLRFDFTCPR